MTKHERTRQQLDPSSCLGAWPLTVFLAAAALTYALIVTVLTAGEITVPVLSVLSMVFLAAACAYVVVATSAYRAPFTSRSHTTMQLLVWAAVISSAASAWQTNRFARDDWWPVSFGLLLLALGPYRPARELAASGTVSALFLGFLTLLQFESFATEAPPAAYVLVVMAPMLALCYASVAFSAAVVASLEDWHRQTVLAGEAMVDRFREGITRSVRQDRVTILGRDVLPYFSDILGRDTVTDGDRDPRPRDRRLHPECHGERGRPQLAGEPRRHGGRQFASRPGVGWAAARSADDERAPYDRARPAGCAVRASRIRLLQRPVRPAPRG